MQLQRKMGFYEKYIKRLLDILCAVLAVVVFCWLYALVAILVRIKIGKPILFKQPRPGMIDSRTGRERIFEMYKFRTMTDERDENGELLSDDIRLTKFGKLLRSTSLDELPEAFNIIKGDMSVIGPRPQLIRDMVFMSGEQRMRHTAKPGMSGLAQVRGRNAITWEEKIDWDLKYIEKITFLGDAKIILETVKVALIRQEGITDGENATALDYGDALLKTGRMDRTEYERKQAYARSIIASYEAKK